jgi:iron complex outermembrane receptor protein
VLLLGGLLIQAGPFMLFRALLLSTSLLAEPIFAQSAQLPAEEPATAADPADHHARESEEIVVTAPFQRNRADVLSGTSVVAGTELTRSLQPTIGETLARQPGVSSTSFGPNASRPVLRGFQGERVRILTEGIGSFDVSNTSVDHAVAINPLTADRIEILRGPSALLFGSSAVGGVVNVIDSRIPRRVPSEGFHVDGLATYGSAADERSLGGAFDAALGGKFVLHFDGSYSKTNDLGIGGFVLSEPLRAQAAASADPEIAELADLRGTLPNSAGRTWEVAAGAAYVGPTANVGFSVTRYDSLYGVPIRYSLDPAAEAEAVRLDVKQLRGDVRADVETGSGFLERIRFRAGIADYRHFELEETGEIGTTFLNDSHEARLELVQATRGPWRGAFGAQYFRRELEIIGEEKFLPPSSAAQYGLFVLQALDFGTVKAEAGLRYEHSRLAAEADADLGNPALRRRFDAFSGSLGASVGLGGTIRFGLNLSHAQRAPSAEELFANGPHAGTQAFEIGNPDFRKEKNSGVEATIGAHGNGYSFSASIYRSWFDDYIFERQTGAIEDDLPVFQYSQADARYDGFEAEASVRIGHIGSLAVNLDGLADYVRARIDAVGPVPRIPPLRLLGGIEAESHRVTARAEIEHVADQDRVSAFETRTEGYNMVNLSASFKPLKEPESLELILSANNLFDVDARRHASFLKDFAPLPGRDIRLSARLRF